MRFKRRILRKSGEKARRLYKRKSAWARELNEAYPETGVNAWEVTLGRIDSGKSVSTENLEQVAEVMKLPPPITASFMARTMREREILAAALELARDEDVDAEEVLANLQALKEQRSKH